MKLFSELGLSAELLKAIDKLGFEQAAPIQAAAIPILMAGRDIVGQSQTGSGKTAAFAIPAIEKTDPNLRAVQALILCPTRELAMQVSEEFHKLALFKRGVTALPIYGGQSYERQFWGLKQGAQIVIGTPGRVMDHMRRGTLRLDSVKMVILDEVDVMLNMGFRDDMETILKGTPPARQTVFFSATVAKPIRELIEKFSRNPESVKIEQKAMTVPTVEQVYYEVDRSYKIDLLTRLIDIHDLKLGIIFCNTKRMVDDLVDHLEAQGYLADRLHGDMTQAMRDRVMNKFRKSGLEFLVATDIAARGIDVDDVQVVFNYDLPYDAEDYVHRIGRTGRAGRSGRAITFVSGRELFQIRNIERYTNTRITRAKIPTAAEVEEARDNVFLDGLRATLKIGDFQKQERLLGRLLEEGFSSTDIASACLAQIQNRESAPSKLAPHAESSERQSRSRSSDSRAPRHESLRDSDRRQAPPDRQSRGQFPNRREHSTPSNPAVLTPAAPTPTKTGPLAPVAPVAVVASAKVAVATAPETPHKTSPLAPAKPKASRSTPPDFTRLYLNLGLEHGIVAGDIVGAILGETGLPAKTVGVIDPRERHTFIDVASETVNAILAKLNRTQIKGRKVKMKVA
ncbi:MAG TPA: DEAD/DEAH box helicase [Verrucomicrobiae bacterium]|jgi:ATP-dependent RNA helicase DeaD|nr:DEAD/DEAH box helicase [Verrucomicrobiae bacterium]